MDNADIQEGRIASLRTGIKMAVEVLQPGSILSPEQKIHIAITSLQALLDSDVDKSLGIHD